MNEDGMLVAYAVARFGQVSHTAVVEALVEGIDDHTLRSSIDEYGLQAVAEQFLRTLVGDRTLYADRADAQLEAERVLDTDPAASPRVHAVTVTDLAELFTRLGLTDPP